PVAPLGRRIDHVGVAEISLLERLIQCCKNPIWHCYLLDLRRDNFKHTGLQNHLWIGLVNFWRPLPRTFDVRQKIRLATPKAQASADELGAGVLEHADVVIQIAAAVEQALHGNGAEE